MSIYLTSSKNQNTISVLLLAVDYNFLLQVQLLICCFPNAYSAYGPAKPYGPAHEYFLSKHRNLIDLWEQKDAVPKGAYAELFVHDAKSSSSPVVSHFAFDKNCDSKSAGNSSTGKVSLMPIVLIRLIASYDEIDCIRDETLVLNNFLKQCKSSQLQSSLPQPELKNAPAVNSVNFTKFKEI